MYSIWSTVSIVYSSYRLCQQCILGIDCVNSVFQLSTVSTVYSSYRLCQLCILLIDCQQCILVIDCQQCILIIDSSNPARDEVYSVQLYLIEIFSGLWLFDSFRRVLRISVYYLTFKWRLRILTSSHNRNSTIHWKSSEFHIILEQLYSSNNGKPTHTICSIKLASIWIIIQRKSSNINISKHL